MFIDFSKVSILDQPVLTLQNADGTDIQTLGYAFNLKADLCYNETSSITFDLPAYVDGEKTPRYDDVIGMRVIDMDGWGKFILVNPTISMDGSKEIKSCKAYSLEYELTYKVITLEESTYNFYNPVSPENTILGIICEYLPSWSIGTVDDDLIGRYRTFSASGDNIYNFIKSTIQDTYSCIFDFDTNNRTINVKSTSSYTKTAPTYISLDNLAKTIDVSEDTESIVTVLDVNGADGVSIRSVNPLGTNKIYNLDYYIKTNQIDSELASKWSDWQEKYKNRQLSYYNTRLEYIMKSSQITAEESRLRDMEGTELGELTNLQAVKIEFIASLSEKESDEYKKAEAELKKVNEDITTKEAKITRQKEYINELKRDKETLLSESKNIISEIELKSNFSKEEFIILDRFFKEDSISESSFVVTTAESYADDDVSRVLNGTICKFSNNVVTKIMNDYSVDMYTIKGGSIVISEDSYIKADVISATFEMKEDNSFILSCYLGDSVVIDDGEKKYESGCISIAGTCSNVITNVVPDTDMPDAYLTGTGLQFNVVESRFYFTRNLTEYCHYSIEWELFKYGEDCLRKLCYPSYSFSVSSANFFALDEFESFTKELSLGKKIYLELNNENVIEPILIGVSIDFENINSLDLKFGDKYTASDSTFNLVDLLEQSISMGKTLDTSRFNYSSFIDSGASTQVKDFMTSALDVAKNKILSKSNNMGVSWGSEGIRCRKYTEDKSGYDPEQLAIINNSIVLTKDGWQTVEMAIGKFEDTNAGTVWGVCAPTIVGTLLAGENLIIESLADDGETVTFKVDGNGALLHNASFDIVTGDNNSHIALNPDIGFGIGKYPIIKKNDNDAYIMDEDNAKFFVNKNGDVVMKGTLSGCDGYFDGTIYANKIVVANDDYNPDADGEPDTSNTEKVFDSETNKFKTEYLDLGNIIIDGISGDITLGYTDSSDVFHGSIFLDGGDGSISLNGKININNIIKLDGATGTIEAVNITGSEVTGSQIIGSRIVSRKLGESYIEFNDGTLYSKMSTEYVTDHSICEMSDGTLKMIYTSRNADGGMEYELHRSTLDSYGLNFSTDGSIELGGIQLVRSNINTNDNIVKIYSKKAIGIFPWEDTYEGAFYFGNNNADYNSFRPSKDNTCYVGGYDSRFKGIYTYDVYTVNEPTITSDRRLKCNISKYNDSIHYFYDKLNPISYELLSDSNRNIHFGFVAQDVYDAMLQSGIDPNSTSIISKTKTDITDYIKDGVSLGLRYGELIPLNTYMIQDLRKRIIYLENKIKELEM